MMNVEISEILEANLCKVCQKPAPLKCGGCRIVSYCNKQHQKDDWPRHKQQCKPFKMGDDEVLGRFLLATRRLKPGDLVLKEPPLIWGPAQDSIPICLGCGKEINADNSRPCTKCGWPVCGELCEKSPGHLPECRYTIQRGDKVNVKNFGIPHPIYKCITVLRCLYQKQFLPKTWRKIDMLQSHCDARRTTSNYENDRIGIAEFIRRFFKLSNFSEEEIMRICGIVAVNSHEVPLSEPPHIAIYGTASFFEHSCTANCTKSFTDKGEMLITAACNIDQGEHLSICYTDPLWGTPNRRHFLQATKFFQCRCPRCLDPTEFNTHFSAIKCQKKGCNGGLLLPESFTEFHNKLPDWICGKCAGTFAAYSVHDILERISGDLFDLNKTNPEECKKFLAQYRDYLPENHFYFTEVKLNLLHTLGQKGVLQQISDEDLTLKLKLCENLVVLIKIIAPAEKRTLGLVLFEMHAAIAETTRRRVIGGLCPPESMRSNLTDSKKILIEAIDLLRHEPKSLPEGKIHQQAVQNLKDLNVLLSNIPK